MPSSIPRPARRIGTTRGLGRVRATPSVAVSGVVTVVARCAPRGCLVSHEGDKFLDKLAENRAGGVYRAQQGQLMGDERMIHDVEFTSLTLAHGGALVAFGSRSDYVLAGTDSGAG